MFGLVGRARGFFDRLDFFFFLKLKNNLPRTSMGQQLSESWEAGGPQGRQGKADPGSQACLPPQPGSRAVGRTRGSPSPGDKNGLRSGRDVGLWKGSARGGGGMAVGNWRPALMRHYWGRSSWSWGADMGPWAAWGDWTGAVRPYCCTVIRKFCIF